MYFCQPSVTPASIEVRLVIADGITLSLYSADCSSKISQQGMLTTRAEMPSAANKSRPAKAISTSEPVAKITAVSSSELATTYAPFCVPLASSASITGNPWRVSTMAVGPSVRSSAIFHACAVSFGSAGRTTCMLGIARSAMWCSIG